MTNRWMGRHWPQAAMAFVLTIVCACGPGGGNGNGNDNSSPPTVDDLPDTSADDALGQGERPDALVPGLIFLGYDAALDAATFTQLAGRAATDLGGQLFDLLPEIRVASIQVSPGSETAAVALAIQFDGVEFAEVDAAGVIAEATDLLPQAASVEFAQYQLFVTGAIQARGLGVPSTTTIAVLDTGCDLDHAELRSSFLFRGFNYLDGTADVSDDVPGGHGTAAVSLIAASADTGQMAGMTPSVAVTVHKVCDASGFCPLDAVVPGILGALVGNADADLSTAEIPLPDVLCAGFSFQTAHRTLERAIAEARRRGVTVVAPAGNNGRSAAAVAQRYPAAFSGVIAVAATDIRDLAAPFSNRATSVDLAAPGVDLFVAAPGDLYRYADGTSLAAAQVAAAAAWILDLEPQLAPDDVLLRLRTRADALPVDGGFGGVVRRLNVAAAVADQAVRAEPYIIRDDKLVAATGVAVATTATAQASQTGGQSVAEALTGEKVHLYGYFPRGATFEIADGDQRTTAQTESVAASTIDLFLTYIRGIRLGQLTATFSVLQQAVVIMPNLGGERRQVQVQAASGETRSDPRALIYNPLTRGYNIVAYKTFDSAVIHLREEEGDDFDPQAADIDLLGSGPTPEIAWTAGGLATKIQLGSSLSPDYLVVAEAGMSFTPPVRLGACIGAAIAEQVCGEGVALPDGAIARIIVERTGPAGATELALLDVIYVP